jgi:hypothetical protein
VRQKLAVLFNLCYNYIIRKNKGVYMNLTDEQVKTLDIELIALSFTIGKTKATRIVEKMHQLMNTRLLSKRDFINLALGAKVIIENE